MLIKIHFSDDLEVVLKNKLCIDPQDTHHHTPDRSYWIISLSSSDILPILAALCADAQ